jgi:actin-related protein
MRTMIIDAGAYDLKHGYSTDEHCKLLLAYWYIIVRITRNAISKSHDKKIWVGNEIDELKSTARLLQKSPFERGYLACWDVQKEIFDALFTDLDVNPK